MPEAQVQTYEKRKIMSVGNHLQIPLKKAWLMRDEYKRVDPTVLERQEKIKLQEKVTNIFKNIALEWYSDKWIYTTTKDTKLSLNGLKGCTLSYIGKYSNKRYSSCSTN